MYNLEANKWDVINREISRSKIKRTDYKSILGETLTEKAYRYYKKGRRWEECFVDVIIKLEEYGITDRESLRKVKIRICASYSEQDTNRKVFIGGFIQNGQTDNA